MLSLISTTVNTDVYTHSPGGACGSASLGGAPRGQPAPAAADLSDPDWLHGATFYHLDGTPTSSPHWSSPSL